MLDAGVEVLLRDGISLGASTLRYADAFELLQSEHGIKVTRGSVHERIWSSQEAWQLDVLAASIAENEEGRRLTVNAAVEKRLGELPMDSTTDRLNMLAESCRVGCVVFLEAVKANPEYRLFPVVVAAWKASATNLPEFDRLGQMLADAQRDAYDRLQASTAGLLEFLGLDGPPQRGLSFDAAVRVYCIEATALAYSHTLRSQHDPVLFEPVHARCPDGERRPWNHLGLSLWLTATGLFTPRSEPSAEVVL